MRERSRPHTSTQYTFIPTRQVLVLAVSIKLLPSSLLPTGGWIVFLILTVRDEQTTTLRTLAYLRLKRVVRRFHPPLHTLFSIVSCKFFFCDTLRLCDVFIPVILGEKKSVQHLKLPPKPSCPPPHTHKSSATPRLQRQQCSSNILSMPDRLQILNLLPSPFSQIIQAKTITSAQREKAVGESRARQSLENSTIPFTSELPCRPAGRLMSNDLPHSQHMPYTT